MMRYFILLAALVLFTSATYCYQTILRRGSRGSCVEILQRAVGTTSDGIFGRNTETAVRQFQQAKGLIADGVVGPKTWGAIATTKGASTGTNNCGCTYNSATGCSGGPTVGARKLESYLMRTFSAKSMGIYNCRSVRGGQSYSSHAEGRAVDIAAVGPKGTKIYNHLKSMASQYGIQEIIWEHKRWTMSGERYFSPANHFDHVHVALNKCGAQKFAA